MNLAPYIDHTLISPKATTEQIENLCDEALKYHFFSVCVRPCHILLAKQSLEGSQVCTCSFIGGVKGEETTEQKRTQTLELVELGVDEIDFVINLEWAKNGKWGFIKDEIQEIVEAAQGKITKAILETGSLSVNEIISACRAAELGRADFVKTSTGRIQPGATIETIQLMRRVVSSELQIKASGGIRTAQTAIDLVLAGADRIGTSSGVSIVNELLAGV